MMAFVFRIRSVFLSLWKVSILAGAFIFVLNGCGGGGDDTPPPPEGYKLTVAGGTLNDGTAPNGLAVLVTLRDSDGRGPGGVAPWSITITGPEGVEFPPIWYDDGSPGSYIAWIWNGVVPKPGTYTAEATDGSTVRTVSFTIDETLIIDPPVLDLGGGTVSWPEVAGAGSYYYQITTVTTSIVTDDGYLDASTLSFDLPALPDGSYEINVYAHTKNRFALMNDPTPSPLLPSQENISVASLPLTVTGSSYNYSLNARGGVMSYSDNAGGYEYGLVIWTSILPGEGVTPPDLDWTITVTGPGITSWQYTYPGSTGLFSHYLNWDFFTTPAAGVYTVTATSPAPVETLTDSFTIANVTAQLPITANLQVTPTAGGGAEASWDPVPGAASYYVNLWYDNLVSGEYEQIAGGWVTTPAAVITASTMTPGEVYDLYVTASTMDMTDMLASPPPVPGTQVDMSDNVYDEARFVAQ
ncbi:MAG TPA: hypothetical protein DCO77_12750 [Nitrospiraceae bacterium]|nr:hypothetical protein [Nitrospiraceae bacterium]